MQRTLQPTKRGFAWEMKHNRTLYVMCVPALLLLMAFAYLPMSGIYMAFTKYNVVDGIFGSPFVGFENFSFFLTLTKELHQRSSSYLSYFIPYGVNLKCNVIMSVENAPVYIQIAV